jgi:hypothetical protein
MIDDLLGNYWRNYQSVTRAVTDVMWKQWRWLDAQWVGPKCLGLCAGPPFIGGCTFCPPTGG